MGNILKFIPKAKRINAEQANSLKHAILGFGLPSEATDDILIAIHRHETGNSAERWRFVMLSPEQCLLIWKAIKGFEKPLQTRDVFDLVITHIEPNTGLVTLTRDELAQMAEISPREVSRSMSCLEGIGAITRERTGVRVRYRINPYVGWNGKLEKREAAASAAPAPPSVVAEKKPCDIEVLRQLVLDFGFPPRERESILTILERHQATLMAGNKLGKKLSKKFNMINQTWCLEIWKAIDAGEKPKETKRVFDYAMTHIEANTGVVTLSCDELAVAAGIAPKHVRSAMARLEEIGAIIREQVKVPGMPGPGNVIYRLNPHVGWNGKLEKRAASSRKTRVPFTVITGGKSSDGAGKDDPPEDAGA